MSESLTAATPADIAASAGPPAERAAPAWAAVVSLSLGVFGLVTAEFLPASLLTPMAADLGVSAGAAGQAVTATAVVGAVAAPSMAIVTRRFDRRQVMWALMLLLVTSNLLAATASGLPMLLAARMLLGISLGGFWSMAAAMAMRLVPMRLIPRALSVVFTGVSFATVCAAPVGATIGDIWGWRTAFLVAAALGAVALVVQMLTIPRLPPIGTASIGTLVQLLRRPSLRIVLLVVILSVSGHFAGFTYIRPFLEQVPVLDVATISLVLLAFGIGGFFGNFAGGFIAERSVTASIVFGSLLIAAAATALLVAGSAAWIAGTAIAIWGFAFSALPVGFQTWTVRAAPDHAESAGGLLVAAFQVAIASGAIFGGVLVDGRGPLGAVGYAAVATAIGAAAIVAFGGKGPAAA